MVKFQFTGVSALITWDNDYNHEAPTSDLTHLVNDW